MNSGAKLIWLCGKMAAGKSTLARDLAEREDAILLEQPSTPTIDVEVDSTFILFIS